MKFGLFVTPKSSNVLRVINGVWTEIPTSHPDGCITPKRAWKALLTIPGRPVDGATIARHEHLESLLISRAAAKLIYGVPDNVDIYTVTDANEEYKNEKDHQ